MWWENNYNEKRLKSLRRTLRRNQTSPESRLWSKLRNKQMFGFKFYRQYSVGSYILDFFCPKIKLAIEVDGGQHNIEGNKKWDAYRTEYLKGKGIKVIRFWNNEVMSNLEGVMERILAETRSESPPGPLFSRGGNHGQLS